MLICENIDLLLEQQLLVNDVSKRFQTLKVKDLDNLVSIVKEEVHEIINEFKKSNKLQGVSYSLILIIIFKVLEHVFHLLLEKLDFDEKSNDNVRAE